jgi:hypothetical protein
MTDAEEQARINNLIGRVRHLLPSIEKEGWLTLARITNELIDRIEPHFTVDTPEDLSYSHGNTNESQGDKP